MQDEITLVEQIYKHLALSGKVKNQTDFAEQLGITKGYASSIIKDNNLISAGIREKLTTVFNVNPEWLLSGGKIGSVFTSSLVNTGIINNNKESLTTQLYKMLFYKGTVKNQTDFADKLGITKGHMSKLTTGREPLSAAMRQKLTDIFNVNPIWLATNGQQGTMFTTDTPTPLISPANGMVEEPAAPYGPDATPLIPTGGHHTTRSGNQFIELGNDHYLMLTPLVHEYAYGGYQSGFADPEYISDLPKHAIVVDGIHRGTYRTFVMRGDSMDNDRADAIRAGDKVTGRLLLPTHWGSRLHTHKFREWIIHTRSGILVKEIAAHNTQQGTLTLTSKNPDKDLYPDITIPLSDVLEIYNIIEVSKPR